MAKTKEVAITKRLKISEAQQYMLLAVFGAAVALGVATSLITRFIKQISFNTKIIMEEEATIVAYSDVIKNTGTCKKPKGSIYSDDELKKCDPDSIEVSEVSGSLRSDIIEKLANNKALSSVKKDNPTIESSCTNNATGKPYTSKELEENYEKASGADELQKASRLIRSCSALRIIPDALPAFKNEEAMLASLNKIFLLSGWEPESLSPSGTIEAASFGDNLNDISVNFSIETNSDTTQKVLTNIDRSIRDFNIRRATIEWSSNNSLSVQAQSSAYYMDKSSIPEYEKIISEQGPTKTTKKTGGQ